MKKILEHNIIKLKELCLKHGVDKLYAFGSVLTDQFNKDSDIDLLISFKPTEDHGAYADNYFNLITQLEKLLKRKVDLVTEKSLSNPYFIEQLNKTKILLYEN